MSKRISLTRVTIVCAVLVAGLLLVSPLVGVGAADNGTANMTVTTDTETVGTDQPMDVTVQAIDAGSGVSAYRFTLTVDNQVATITEVTTLVDGNDGPITNVSYGPNGSYVTVTTALLDATHNPAATIDLVDVTIQGDANGTTEVEIVDVAELADANARAYNVTQTTNATVDVRPTTPIVTTSNVSKIGVEEQAEITVVATETPLGVSSYNSSVAVDGNATIENIRIPAQSDITRNTTVTADGTLANVAVSNATQTQATNVELFTLTVEGAAAGPANITVAPIDGLTGTNGTAYYSTTESVATLSVTETDRSGGSQSGGGGGAQPISEDKVSPRFEVESVAIETATVTTGETFEVNTTITNTGEAGDNQAIELRIEDQAVASESLTLRGGEKAGVTFNSVSVPDMEGTVTLAVVSENDSVTKTLTIEIPEEEEEANDETNDSTSDKSENASIESSNTTDGEVPGFTASLLVIALVVAGIGLRHRES